MKGSDIKIIKEVLEILNGEFPPAKTIPSINIINREYTNISVEEMPYFSAHYCKYTNVWNLICTNYVVWMKDECRELIEDLRSVLKNDGIEITNAYVFYAAIGTIKKQLQKGELFIGQTENKITIKN